MITEAPLVLHCIKKPPKRLLVGHSMSGLKLQSDWQTLWVQGGYPRAYLASPDQSHAIRENLPQSILAMDIPSLEPGYAASVPGRFWQMMAHLQGQIFNAANLADSLGDIVTYLLGLMRVLTLGPRMMENA